MPDQSSRFQRSNSALLVVDIQERLLPAMFAGKQVVANTVRLIQGARILGVPVFLSEQYRRGLGATVPEMASLVPESNRFEKLAFSAWGEPALRQALEACGRTDLIVCGIEAHVCVTQTALDLLDSGRRVFVAADACASRTRENAELGLSRMRTAGASIGSTEMILYEWLERAGTPEFKEILALVR